MEIAVVGSGPSLAGAGRGSAIDAHGAVLRLFDCAWHNPADHGSAWTWGLIPGPWKRLDFTTIVAGMERRPALGWLAYHFGRPHRRVPLGTRAVAAARWNARLQAVTGRSEIVLTRGFCLFLAAAAFGPRRITGYGFDALRAGSQAGYRYHPGYDATGFDPAKAAARHDAGVERELLHELEAMTGITIELA